MIKKRKTQVGTRVDEDLFGKVLTTVSDGVASAARGAGKAGSSMMEAVRNVTRTAMRGSWSAGRDFLVGAKAIVMGVVRGTKAREDEALGTLSQTARAVILEASDMNGDVAAAATGLVLGAIASARKMGVMPAKAADAARRAAIQEADRIGPTVSVQVRAAMAKDIGGINAGALEPLPK